MPDAENHSFFYYRLAVEWQNRLTVHQHDSWEVMCIISGRGTRVIGDTVEPFEAGEVVLIPPSIPHDWKFDFTTAKIEHALVSFTHEFMLRCMEMFPEMKSRMNNVTFPEHALRLKNPDRIRRTLMAMDREDDFQRLLMLLKLIPEVFSQSGAVRAGGRFRLDKDTERMKKVYGYVMRKYHEEITLDDMAGQMNMGRSSFCVFFKRCCGVSFSEFLGRYRIDRACNLLVESTLSVAEICFAVGFNDVPHFNRVFKKYKGESPGEYRLRNVPEN